MKLRELIIGGMAALALGGCGSAMKYELTSDGLMVPRVDTTKKATKLVGLSVYEMKTMDTNRDGNPDLVEVTVYEKMADFPTKAASKHLIIDSNSDGLVDIVYSDILKKDMSFGSDGNYDLVNKAPQLLETTLGKKPTEKELAPVSLVEKGLPALLATLKMRAKGSESLTPEKGLSVPKYSLDSAVKEERDYPFAHVEAFTVDRNGDKKTDLILLKAYPWIDVTKPLSSVLIVDTDFDGKVDVIYQDTFSEDLTMKRADGKFDSAMNANLFYALNMGELPTDKQLGMEEFKRELFMPDLE